MEQLLYKSEGNPPKRRIFFISCTAILIICGVLLLLSGMVIPFCFIPGLGLIIIGIFTACMNAFNPAQKAKLYLYDNHVEGIQLSPYKEFNLLYQDITDVHKQKTFLKEFIILQNNSEKFTALTNNADKAYQIICDEIYGEV